MEAYKREFSELLARTGAIFFKDGLVLKDGRPTPYFINIGKFNTGKLSYILGSFFADMIFHNRLADKIDIVIGPSYKGSSIALATAISLWKKYQIEVFFDYDRKEYKTYGEMTGRKALMVNDTLFDNCRLFIVDDVVSSMNTKYELIEKIKHEQQKKGIKCNIIGMGVAVDREQSKIEEFTLNTGIGVYRIIGIKELLSYLYNERIPVLINDEWKPMSKELKEKVDEYLRIYGTS